MSKVISSSCDINEQPAICINPSRINDIQFIRLLAVDVIWVDLQHVVSAFWNAGGFVMEYAHVVVWSKVVHRWFGDLDVGIGVPWKNLLKVSLSLKLKSRSLLPSDSTTNPVMCHAWAMSLRQCLQMLPGRFALNSRVLVSSPYSPIVYPRIDHRNVDESYNY